MPTIRAWTGQEIEIPDAWVDASMSPESQQTMQQDPGIPPWVLQGFTAGQDPNLGQPAPVVPASLLSSVPQIPGLNAPLGPLPGIVQPVPVNPASPVGQLIFPFDSVKGDAALESFDQGGGNPDVVLTADDFRQGTMSALVEAEGLAHAKGWSAINADGTLVIGSGEAHADPNTKEGAAYFAVRDAVKNAVAATAPVDPSTPATIGPGAKTVQLAIAPGLVVVLVVLGTAAIVAGAYVLAVKVRADADSLARVKRAAQAADLVRQGLPVPPGLVAPEPPPAGPPGLPGGGSLGFGLGATLALGGVALGALFLLTRK